MDRSFLNFEDLKTIQVEIETLLNNLPSYVYNDENGVLYPLMPAQLVYSRQITITIDGRQEEIIFTYQNLTERA